MEWLTPSMVRLSVVKLGGEDREQLEVLIRGRKAPVRRLLPAVTDGRHAAAAAHGTSLEAQQPHPKSSKTAKRVPAPPNRLLHFP